MMKFGQLPIGQRFRWRGRDFCKTGPLTANGDDGGEQRLVPRSAAVTPVDAAVAPPAPAGVARATVVAALDALGTEVEAVARTLPSEAAESLRMSWTSGRRRFLGHIDGYGLDEP